MRILLKNGMIYDGTGGEPYRADVLVSDGVIERIGPMLRTEADETVDCNGLAVAPGFIDSHSHNDWFTARADKEYYFKPFLEQGITTQVTGNCGFSPFGYDADSPNAPLIGSGLFSKDENSGDLSTLPRWTEASGSIPVNIVPMVGHMSSRISLSGFENRPLTEAELEKQDALLERELEAGAHGVSFGLMYEPDRYAPYEELKRAAEIVRRHNGLITVHSRANSAVSTSYGIPFGGRAHNLRALDEMLRLVRDTGVAMQYSHLIFVGKRSWKTLDESLRLIDQINEEGYDFRYDSYAMLYGASVITVILPGWYLSMPPEKRKSGITKAKLWAEIVAAEAMLGFTFGDIQITWAGEAHRDIIGLRVREIAKRWNMSEVDAYVKLVDDTNGMGRVLMYKYLTPEILDRLMADDRCLYMTDAWMEAEGMQNPAAFCCFPEFLRIAREKNTMARTIRQMTGAAADRFRLKKRGYVKPGYAADLTVFNPATVAPREDLNSAPLGIYRVMVNGAWAVSDGRRDPGILNGQFLLKLEK